MSIKHVCFFLIGEFIGENNDVSIAYIQVYILYSGILHIP